MNGKINGLAKAAASASLVAGAILATAGPAAAATPNSADGAAATGVITVGPLGQATYPGTSPVTVANVNIGGLLTTGVVTDTATATGSSSTIASPSVALGAVASLNAGTITSSCSIDSNTGTVSGTSGVNNGNVTIAGIPTALASNAAPNTTISVLGLSGIASITLNQQTTAPDGTFTVNAVAISLVGSTQTLDIGTSVCNAANEAAVPVLPGKALPIGLGALGVLGVGGIGLAVARRRRTAEVA